MAVREWMLVLAAASSLGLAACHRGAESHGSTAQDTSSKPVPGATGYGGSGTNAMGGPGSGLNGGLNPAPGQSTGVSQGTPNSTPKNSVGNRY